MIRTLVSICALVLAGCSAAPQSSSNGASDPVPAQTPATTSSTPASEQPVLLGDLTDQREVWGCSKCGMEFDRAGMCSMCNVELVRTRIDYTCAADGKPVERGGKCPRCEIPVVVKRTPLVATLDVPALGGH